MERATFVRMGMALVLLGIVAGCATMGGGERAAPVIPAGKGLLVLEAGGIGELNFSVFNQETGKRVVQLCGLHTFLDPGIYRVEVETDFDYEAAKRVVRDDVEIIAGQEKHERVPVGRFMVNVIQEGDQQTPGGRKIQLPFKVYDYGMKTVLLNRGMTSTMKYVVVPVDTYKVELMARYSDESGSHQEHIIEIIEVRFGAVRPVIINLGGAREAQPSE